MITWRQWSIAAAALMALAHWCPLLTFAKVIVTILAVGAFMMAFTGAALTSEQKRDKL